MVIRAKFGPKLNQVQCCEETKKLALSMGFFQISHDEE